MTFAASCLCGAVTWRVPAPVPAMFHCHCSRCRKSHGTAFATYVAAPSAAVALEGAEAVVPFRAPDADQRCHCRHCGSVVPYEVGGTTFAPAGNFEGDPVARPALHMFVGSRAPWFEIFNHLPQHQGFPPGTAGASAVADRPPVDPPGGGAELRGSCLCGAVAFVIGEGPRRRRYCHCGRCRKAGSTAHAANLVTSYEAVHFTRGEQHLSSYKVPDARFFTQVFCPTCGSPAPRRDPGRGISVVPMGALDDDPKVAASGHIFVGSKAPWYEITDGLPQHLEYPPGV